MHLSFNNVKLKAKKNKKAILKEIGKVIDSGIFLNGQFINKLEISLQNYFEKKYFLTCASGHDAILLTLQTLKLKKDDEVIFPANSYPTAFPIFINGVKGIPCDVDENGQLDPDSVIKIITSKTKVIIIVHLYGLVGNLKKIVSISKKNNIFLIEDCAQAFGSRYMGNPVGTFGDFGCFSFYPTKNLGSPGDGGGILVKNKEHYEYLKKAVQYGEKSRYHSEFISTHSRLPEIQAAVLNLYFKNIKTEFKKRKLLSDHYNKQILKYELKIYISVLLSDRESNPVNHLYVIKSESRDKLRKYLKNKKIDTFIHYPLTVNKVAAFSFLSKVIYPKAEELSKKIISLPFHPDISKKEINHIVKSIATFFIK